MTARPTVKKRRRLMGAATCVLMLVIIASSFMMALLLLFWPNMRLSSTSSSSSVEQQQQQYRTIHFAHHTSVFIQNLADCLKSPTCHVLYLHLQKTGGTNLASRLYKLLLHNNSTTNNETTTTTKKEYDSADWCCHERLMDRFHADPEKYCLNTAVGVYEVSAHQFQKVVETCQQRYNAHTYLPMLTLREPIQRTLSMIHHQCNKNYERKSSEEQAICKRCLYYDKGGNRKKNATTMMDDRPYWSSYTNQTNVLYTQLLDLTLSSDLLLLDSTMIDAAMSLLAEELQVKLVWGRKNKELTHVCNFGMPSQLMKQLAPAQTIYMGLNTAASHSYLQHD